MEKKSCHDAALLEDANNFIPLVGGINMDEIENNKTVGYFFQTLETAW